MAPRKTILIIEDEPHIVLGLTDALEFEGFAVVSAGKGRDGVLLARQEKPDAVLLDLMLPDTNGFKVCEELRRLDRFVPIIMLTARSQEVDKIRGLDAGADDYVTKPFSVNELIAEAPRHLLRRAARARRDRAGGVLHRRGQRQHDRPLGHPRLLGSSSSPSTRSSFSSASLFERVGQPVSREEILQKIWGVEAGPSNRTVDNFIVKLRKKIERSQDKPEHILTVYGFGYKLAP